MNKREFIDWLGGRSVLGAARDLGMDHRELMEVYRGQRKLTQQQMQKIKRKPQRGHNLQERPGA